MTMGKKITFRKSPILLYFSSGYSHEQNTLKNSSNTCRELIGNARTLFRNMTQHWDRNILEQEVNQVKKMTMHPDFWTTNPNAQTLVRKQSMLEEKLNFIDGTLSEINNNEELVAMAEMENDEDMMAHIQQQLSNMIKILEQKEIESLMSDPQDSKDCFLEIHTGAGGEDASDWSQMLVNMYMTCIKNSQLSEFDVTLDDISYKETGIRSALLQIRGKYAYGYLKKEQGVHRLVRLSPFDAAVSINHVFYLNQCSTNVTLPSQVLECIPWLILRILHQFSNKFLLLI